MNLYVAVFLMALVVPTLAVLDKELVRKGVFLFSEECKLKLEASDNDVEELASQLPATSDKGKCLRSCLLKEFFIMKEDGTFDQDVALKIVDIHTQGNADKILAAQEIILKCMEEITETDQCDSAEQYVQCLFKETRKYEENLEN